MSLWWLAVLVGRGTLVGWDLDPLWWWLLFPMFMQDVWDTIEKRRRRGA